MSESAEMRVLRRPTSGTQRWRAHARRAAPTGLTRGARIGRFDLSERSILGLNPALKPLVYGLDAASHEGRVRRGAAIGREHFGRATRRNAQRSDEAPEEST